MHQIIDCKILQKDILKQRTHSTPVFMVCLMKLMLLFNKPQVFSINLLSCRHKDISCLLLFNKESYAEMGISWIKRYKMLCILH